MSDIKLFRLQAGLATELQGDASDLEKPLQTLIEKNLDTLLGIRFLASEYATGKTHGGRIDSLGLDENDCPVILEYKRSVGENVINQGLFYLDWLMDHKAEFKLLVIERLGNVAADQIDWSAPRLVCVAADFTKYDGHAVQHINRNIELIRYRRFGEELLLLELANASSASAGKLTPGSKGTQPAKAIKDANGAIKSVGVDKTMGGQLGSLPEPLVVLLTSLEDYLLSLGDDVQRKELKLYIAFKTAKELRHRSAAEKPPASVPAPGFGPGPAATRNWPRCAAARPLGDGRHGTVADEARRPGCGQAADSDGV